MDTENRRGFATSLGAIAAAAGGAIGLGNIWRFPYTVGVNGGAAFIVVYLLFAFLLGMPVMLCEFTIGRNAQSNVIDAFGRVSPKHHAWKWIGIMGFVCSMFIYSFYSVVAGWTFHYVILSCKGALVGLPSDEISNVFRNFTAGTWEPLLSMGMILLFTGIIITAGIEKGIERFAKILMPILFGIMLLLCVRSVSLPNASEGLAFLFHPDFSKLDSRAILSALGQALFSLSIGMGAAMIYGSYIRKEDSLFKTSLAVTAADTFIALLAGIAIFPAVFAFGLSPASGPSLVYEVMPNVFNSMPGGVFFAILFFVLLTIAAVTSTISLMEIPVSYISEKTHFKRSGITFVVSLVVFGIGTLASLSFGLLADFTIFNHTIFDFLDMVTSTYLMPIGAIGITLYVGWVMPKDKLVSELSNEGSLKIGWFKFFYFIIRYIAPLALLIVLVSGILKL